MTAGSPSTSDRPDNVAEWATETVRLLRAAGVPAAIALVLAEIPQTVLGAFFHLWLEPITSSLQGTTPDAMVSSVAEILHEGAIWFLVMTLSGFVTFAATTAIVAEAARRAMHNERPTVGELFGASLPRIPALAAVGAIYGLAVAVGLLLCCAPMFVAMALLGFATTVVVFENVGPVAAAKRSVALAKAAFVPALVLVIAGVTFQSLIGCVGGGIGGVAGLGLSLGGGDPSRGMTLITIVSTILSAGTRVVYTLFFGTCFAVGFARTRAALEGHGTRDMASVFQ
jgi:hypothetical protein